MTLPDLDAVALAAESSPRTMATMREEPIIKCRHAGCDNLAARSDQKCYRHSSLKVVSSSLVEEVNERLKSYAPEAADLVIEAARAGAPDGDHKAAAWLLTHSGVVKPVAPEPRGTGLTGGVTVHVGIILPGLPGGDE